MNKRTAWTLALATAALLAAPTFAQPPKETKPVVATMAGEKAAEKGVRAEIERSIGDAQEKLMALAEAMPADKYGWRPGTGVRSVGEVYMHVASANYFLPTLWGGKMPEGVDVRGLEKLGGDKAKSVEALKKSFEHVRAAMAAVPAADLERAVKLFDHQGTVREAFLIVASHAHEHLGQSIAYARMNSVTPPWSAAGN